MPTYTLQQRIFMYDLYVITSSCREVVRRFQAYYPGVCILNREAVRLLVNKFKQKWKGGQSYTYQRLTIGIVGSAGERI